MRIARPAIDRLLGHLHLNRRAPTLDYLHRLVYASYVGGVYTSLHDGTLSRYLPCGLEKTDVAAEDVAAVLADVFGADPSLYIEAAEIRRRYSHAQ